MIGLTDAYVVGFSVVLLYVLKTYFRARAVWKQFGCVSSLPEDLLPLIRCLARFLDDAHSSMDYRWSDISLGR